MGVAGQREQWKGTVRPGGAIQLPGLVQQPDLRHIRIETVGGNSRVGAAVAHVVEPGELDSTSSK